ncbi:MAG: hypothetical protein E7374_00730 [Clostridiales bacterium]|nr:hypothetical protein [Clostridiales bacterium]
MEYKRFKLGNLFDVDSWVYGKNKQWISRFTNPANGRIPVISGITINNGINYYTTDNYSNEEVFENDLTISTRGEYSGTITYHEGKFLLANNILVMKMPGLSSKQKLFMASAISKIGYGGYNNYPRKETLKEDYVYLPSSDGVSPDYNYMERLINELERERINKLDKCLTATGLNDWCLDDHDISILNATKKFKIYKVSNLFDIHPTKTYGINNSDLLSKDGVTPVVANTSNNNGIGGYSNLKPNEKGGIITFSDTTTADSIFYQPNDFIGFSHVQGMYPLNDLWNGKSLQYFMTVFKNVALSKNFDYANKFNRKLALNFEVSLPTADGINPDYNYMEEYIRAIEKLVIKDVVKYKDEIIKQTKHVSN